MKYKKFETEKSALEFSAGMCESKGCNGVTKYWYNVIEAIDGWYVVIHDDAEIEGATEVEPKWIANEERPSA